MASTWHSNPGIRITALHMNSMGNFNKVFSFFVAGAQAAAHINGDPNGWKWLDIGEMSDEDFLTMVQVITSAHATQRPVWILEEHFLGNLTNRVKGIYVW
jgi:hypothetical protein